MTSPTTLPESQSSPTAPPRVRLNKYLASAGIAARRKADALITAGRVGVNGQVVRTLGIAVNPTTDRVSVDGKPVTLPPIAVVYALYKPRGVVSTAHDPDGRQTVVSLVPPEPRVFPVGRLDQESEGLILLTNDGDLALRLTHPRYEHRKRYRASTSVPRRYNLAELQTAIATPRLLDGRHRSVDHVRYVGRDELGLVFDIEVHEGMKHLVRRLLDRAGLTTLRLVRTAHGPIELGDLTPGQWRCIDPTQFSSLAQNPRKA